MEIEYILYHGNEPETVWIEVEYEVWNSEIFLGEIKVTDENGLPVKVNQKQYDEIVSFCYGVCEQDFSDRKVDYYEMKLEERRYV